MKYPNLEFYLYINDGINFEKTLTRLLNLSALNLWVECGHCAFAAKERMDGVPVVHVALTGGRR